MKKICLIILISFCAIFSQLSANNSNTIPSVSVNYCRDISNPKVNFVSLDYTLTAKSNTINPFIEASMYFGLNDSKSVNIPAISLGLGYEVPVLNNNVNVLLKAGVSFAGLDYHKNYFGNMTFVKIGFEYSKLALIGSLKSVDLSILRFNLFSLGLQHSIN
jgi:hypothetical protein